MRRLQACALRPLVTRLRVCSRRHFSGIREMVVTRPEHVAELRQELDQAEVVGVDTEFISHPYYRNRPQLVQLATPSVLALLDCQAFPRREVIHPILESLFSKELVLHHAEQDFQVLYDLSVGLQGRRVASRLFDTQVAASFLGMGTFSAYGTLVEYVCGVQLDKTQALTDWSTRPFTPKQLEYALDDVRYILALRNELQRRLKEAGREEWFWAHTDRLLKEELYAPRDPKEAYKFVRRLGKLSDPQELAILKELAAWREVTARVEDKQPTFVLRDETLISIAQQRVSTMFELGNIQGVKEIVLAKYGKAILDAVKRGLETPEGECPTKAESFAHHDPDSAWTLQEFMWSYLCSVSRTVGIGPEVLCPKEELKLLAEHDFSKSDNPLPDVVVLKDWRKHVVGDALLALRAGEPLCFDPSTRQLRLANHEHTLACRIQPYAPPPPAPLQPRVSRELSPAVLQATTAATAAPARPNAAPIPVNAAPSPASAASAVSYAPRAATVRPRPPIASWAEVRKAPEQQQPQQQAGEGRTVQQQAEEEEEGEIIAAAGVGMVTPPAASSTKAPPLPRRSSAARHQQ